VSSGRVDARSDPPPSVPELQAAKRRRLGDTLWLWLRGPVYRRAFIFVVVGVMLVLRANSRLDAAENRTGDMLDFGVTTDAKVIAADDGVMYKRLTVEFRTQDGTNVDAWTDVDHLLPVGTDSTVSYDPAAPTHLVVINDTTDASAKWTSWMLLLGLGLCIAAPVSAVRTFRKKRRAARPPPPPPVTPHEIAKALRDRAKPWSGAGTAPWAHLAFPRRAPDAWQAFDTAIGTRYRWVRGHRVRPGVQASLVSDSGEVIASLVHAEHAKLVKIDGVAVYERHSVRGAWYVTEIDGGDLVLTGLGSHIGKQAGMEFRFPDGRTVWFPVTVGSERDVGVSDSGLRRVGVMFGVDDRGRQVCMARTRTGSSFQPRSPTEIDVVVCGDRTRQGLLVALLAAPVVTTYFNSPGGG
jgi:hypothetical protein